jgi:Crp-like helix-turn-helix domain
MYPAGAVVFGSEAPERAFLLNRGLVRVLGHPVTLVTAATEVGSVREVVARAVRDLRRAGVIERHPDGVRIADYKRLLLEAGIGD